MQISEFGRDIDHALASLREVLPDDLQIERTSDEPAIVREKIGDFNRNLIEAVVIVIVVALLFMEWRCALLVACSIPLTVAMTLGMCHAMGVDLQQVSIAALIIALGLLVDDPVVAGDAINRELAHGQPRDVAAWLGPQKLARAILFATLTNCVAFLPLLLVTGKTGEFIWSLPVVVTASLVASRIVSMTFMPLLGYYVLRGQKGLEAGLTEGGRGATFARYYNGFSEWCLDHKTISLGICLLILGVCVACLPLVGTAFFPAIAIRFSRSTCIYPRVRRSARPPQKPGGSWDRSTLWRDSTSVRSRHLWVRVGRGSGCRSSPNSGRTTMPRSWCIRRTARSLPKSCTD